MNAHTLCSRQSVVCISQYV